MSISVADGDVFSWTWFSLIQTITVGKHPEATSLHRLCLFRIPALPHIWRLNRKTVNGVCWQGNTSSAVCGLRLSSTANWILWLQKYQLLRNSCVIRWVVWLRIEHWQLMYIIFSDSILRPRLDSTNWNWTILESRPLHMANYLLFFEPLPSFPRSLSHCISDVLDLNWYSRQIHSMHAFSFPRYRCT